MTDKSVDVVKRNGRRPTEDFSRDKLHSSVVAACLSDGVPVGHAEKIANAVCEHVDEWLEPHHEVTSHDIRRVAARKLHVHHPDAAYLYEQHRLTI